MSPIDSALKWLHTGHEPKWDFVLFRCTYKDDQAWTRCLERLQTCTSASLHRQDGIVMLNWVIREDVELDGADADTVRGRFQKLCASWNKPPASGPCYEACLLVDNASLQSIVGHDGDDTEPEIVSSDSSAYVNVVDVSYDSGKTYEMGDYKGVVKAGVYQLAQLFASIRDQSLDKLYPGSDVIWSEVAYGSGNGHATTENGKGKGSQVSLGNRAQTMERETSTA